MFESELSHIAVWGLLFALLNLFISVDKHLRDSDQPAYSKIVVAIIAAILVGYAFEIVMPAMNALLGNSVGVLPSEMAAL